MCTLQEPDEFCGKQLFALINDEVSNFLKSRYLCIWKNGGPSIEVAGTNQRIAHAPGKKDRQRCETWKFFDNLLIGQMEPLCEYIPRAGNCVLFTIRDNLEQWKHYGLEIGNGHL